MVVLILPCTVTFLIIQSFRSKVFRAMLTTTSSKEAKSGSLTIKDFEKSTVDLMVNFCYTGDLAEDDVARLIELLLLVGFLYYSKKYTFILSFRGHSKNTC